MTRIGCPVRFKVTEGRTHLLTELTTRGFGQPECDGPDRVEGIRIVLHDRECGRRSSSEEPPLSVANHDIVYKVRLTRTSCDQMRPRHGMSMGTFR